MTSGAFRFARVALATAAGMFCLFVEGNLLSSTQQSGLVAQADARVGRPLTPGSVAGVNRRVHRRAYYGSGYSYGHPYAGSHYRRPYRY